MADPLTALENLKLLRDQGLVNEAEFEARRLQIVDEMTNTSVGPSTARAFSPRQSGRISNPRPPPRPPGSASPPIHAAASPRVGLGRQPDRSPPKPTPSPARSPFSPSSSGGRGKFGGKPSPFVAVGATPSPFVSAGARPSPFVSAQKKKEQTPPPVPSASANPPRQPPNPTPPSRWKGSTTTPSRRPGRPGRGFGLPMPAKASGPPPVPGASGPSAPKSAAPAPPSSSAPPPPGGRGASRPVSRRASGVTGLGYRATQQTEVKTPEFSHSTGKRPSSKRSSGFRMFGAGKKIDVVGASTQASPSYNELGTIGTAANPRADGWITSETRMVRFDYNDATALLTPGQRVVYDTYLDAGGQLIATHIRTITRLDDAGVQECLDKTGKTRGDADYYVHGTALGDTVQQNLFYDETDENEIIEQAECALNAFINSKGGVVFFGMSKDSITGAGWTQDQRARISNGLMEVVSRFRPSVPNLDSKLTIRFIPVVQMDGLIRTDCHVLRAAIIGGIKDDRGLDIIFSTQNGDRFRKQLSYVVKVA